MQHWMIRSHTEGVVRRVEKELVVAGGDEVEFTVSDAAEVPLRGGIGGSADQHWFWEPEWQAGEREADEQIKAGDVEVFGDVNAMFAALSS